MALTLRKLKSLISECLRESGYDRRMDRAEQQKDWAKDAPYPHFTDEGDAVAYLVEHWTEITGEGREHLFDEGHWHPKADEFLEHVEACGLDPEEFQETWIFRTPDEGPDLFHR